MKKYDYIVIGGGAAGFSSIVKISELTDGKSNILLVSKGPLGGTCVNTGCVPSKTIIEIAKHVKNLNRFIDRGVEVREFNIDTEKIFSSIRELVNRLRRDKYEEILKNYENVDFIEGYARFQSPNKIIVEGDGENIVEGGKILIATGSRPFIPIIEGIENVKYYTTDNIWMIEDIPSKMVVVGSGAIGLELSQAFARLGVDVHVIEVLDRPIPSTEPEISRMLVDILSREGVKFHFKTRVVKVEKKNGEIVVEASGNEGKLFIDAEMLFIATGRKPNTDALRLENAGVRVDGRGFIKVNEKMETSNPNIYAAGDVAGSPKPALLETIAAREGVVAAISMTGNNPTPIDYGSIPVVVFTDPELAYVGLTEKEVMDRLGACACRGVRFKNMPKSSILNNTEGYAKIIVDPYTGVIKGLHVLSPYASEIILQGSLYIKHGYRVGDVIDVIQVFPTVSELVKASAQAFIRRIDLMPCCVE